MNSIVTLCREILLPLINTIILIAIFIYQKNRNKILSERILEQSALLKETSELVAKQATAITSHGTIVESAIKYSQCFDSSKIEDIIRREVSLEKEEEIRKLKNEYENHVSTADVTKNEPAGKFMEMIAQTSASVAQEMFSDIIMQYILLLIDLPESERDKSVAEIRNESARSLILSILEKVYARIGSAQLNQIAKNKEQEFNQAEAPA